MFNIVLITPQIPNNTGAIGRLCVNTGSTLHLVKPLGFDIDQKAIRRAGLDYWHRVDLKVWSSMEQFLDSIADHSRLFFATTKTDNPYFEQEYRAGDYLLFGSETTGIDEALLREYRAQCITIPMAKEGRSLNLAISSAIVLYSAIEKNYASFKELKCTQS